GTYNLFAPRDVTITNIQTSTYYAASPVYSDYSITFYHCRDVQMYFAHVKSLSAAVSSQMGKFTNQTCLTNGTGGGNTVQCNLETNIPLTAGTLLGTLINGGDWGAYDFRQTPLAFVSPSRHFHNTLYTACPLDYFV